MVVGATAATCSAGACRNSSRLGGVVIGMDNSFSFLRAVASPIICFYVPEIRDRATTINL
jgi:hypothetical protein